jgi:GNAT superfamily N-acetyltransferase
MATHPAQAVHVLQVANADLCSGLTDLISEACAEGFDWIGRLPTDWSRRRLVGVGEGLFVAVGDGQLFGMAAITADPALDDDRTGRLRYVYVRVPARGRGIAALLLKTCLRRACDKWSMLRLHTDNPAAARLYERHGFSPLKGDPRNTHMLDMREGRAPRIGNGG